MDAQNRAGRMRKLVTVVAVSLAGAGATTLVATPVQAGGALCGTPKTGILYAGQTTNAGSVVVGNDADNLYVTLTATGGWLLNKTHVHAADSLVGIPVNKAGNPQIGTFRHQAPHVPPVATYTYTMPRASVSPDVNVNAVVAAAHAELVKLDGAGAVAAAETGWGEGRRFTERGSWGTYMEYTWQACASPPPASQTETAFARLLPAASTNAADGDPVTCFLELDLNRDGVGDFNRWGWTNGALAAGTHSFDLHAGAGRCDPAKGTKVGTLTVDYDGSTATVRFQASGKHPLTGLDYKLQETHLYVGSEVMPKNKLGEPTAAPGQYPTIHGELKGVTSDSYSISGLSGPIYVVAHATVSGFPLPAA